MMNRKPVQISLTYLTLQYHTKLEKLDKPFGLKVLDLNEC